MKVNIDWDQFDSKHYRPLVVDEVPNFKPGTISYDDYWDEQDDRCLNGFKPKPYMPRISGRHYFYLNMCKIKLLKKGASNKTFEHPFYRELDRRLYNEITDARKNKYGLIVGKPRRVGLSYVGTTSVGYELLFHRDNEVGVAAGLEEKAQDFYEKVKEMFEHLRPEYRAGILIKNSEKFKLGYEDYINKQKVDKGLKSQMYIKTMFSKPTGFEGKSLSLAIFEEAGLFQDLIAAYIATKPCFAEGSFQFGTPLVYGTGGEIDKGSKGYKEMWYANRAIYNLKKIFVSATDYYPGDGIPDPITKKSVSFFDFRTGRTNGEAALKHIVKERQEKDGSEGFVKHIQQYPLKESDIFIKNSGGLLNRKKLNAQMRNQDNCPFERKLGRLEWRTNDPKTIRLVAVARDLKEIDKIHFSRDSKIVFKEDEELGTVWKILDPIKTKGLPYWPDIGGCDSYDEDDPGEHASLGGTIIYRCFYGINNPYDLPVAYILDRDTADSDDEFYSQTLRLSIFYKVEMLVEYTKIAILNYYKDVGAHAFLKLKPDLDGSGYTSKAKNVYGFKVPNQYATKLILRLLKAEVNINFNNYWFMEILSHLVDYGESNSDLGSALGMVLVSKLDMFGEMSEGIEEEPGEENLLEGMGFYEVINGEAVFRTYGDINKFQENEQMENDPFSVHTMRAFDPEYDLVGQEQEEYHKAKIKQQKDIKTKRKEVLEKYGGDIMAFTLEEHNQRIKEN